MSTESREDRLNQIIADYLAQVESGATPNRESLVQQYPDFAEDLRTFFADHDRMGNLAQPKIANDATISVSPGNDRSVSPPTSLGSVRYFGDYELLEEIARGGMGIVYKAKQVSLNRVVALKMILTGQLASATDILRFHAEAEAAANLDHPNILPIYEVGEYQGHQYFSMKLIEGGSLASEIRSQTGKMDPDRTREWVEILVRVAQAVHFAHQRGILHRDLKPANILLDREGTPYVTDFGLAKRIERDSGITQSGTLVGTPSYMAPEQARAEKQVTTSIDVYSLGAILYEILTGEPPFRASTILDTILQVINKEPIHPQLIRSDSDRDLTIIALKCLEKDPSRRYESAATFADDLERWLRGEPIAARPVTTPERVWKWAKRHPSTTALVGVSLLTIVAVIVILAISNTRIQNALALQENTARQLAQSLENEKANAYANRIALADIERIDQRPDRAEQVLDECPAEFRGMEWNYLKRICHPEYRRFETDSNSRSSWVGFLPTGHLAFQTNNAINVREIKSGKIVKEWPNLLDPFVFSRDGKRMLCFGLELKKGTKVGEYWEANMQAIRVWDIEQGKEIARFTGHTYTVDGMALSPDGKLVASSVHANQTTTINDKQYRAADDDTLTLWDTETGKVIRKFPDAHGKVAFLPNGQSLVAESFNRIQPMNRRNSTGLTLYELSGKVIRKLDQSEGFRHGLSVSANGRIAAAINYDETLRLWDISTGKVIYTSTEAGTTTAFHPKLPVLATMRPSQRVIHLWTVQDQIKKVRTLTGACEERQGYLVDSNLAFSPDGPYLAAQGLGSTIRVWDTSQRIENQLLTHQEFGGILTGNSVDRVRFSPDGSQLALGNDAHVEKKIDAQTKHPLYSSIPAISLWNASSGVKNPLRKRGPGTIRDFAFRAGTSEILMVQWPDYATGSRILSLWDSKSDREVWTITCTGDLLCDAVEFAPDGSRFALIGEKTLQVRSAVDGSLLIQVPASGRNIAWSPDGLWIAIKDSASSDEVYLHSATDGQLVRKLKGPPKTAPFGSSSLYIGQLAFSPDGRWIASSTLNNEYQRQGNGAITLWDVQTGEERMTLRGHTSAIYSIAFSPDGKRLASGSSDKTIRIWDVSLGRTLLTLRGHQEGIRNIAISPDGLRLASTDGKETFLWDMSPPFQKP